MLRVIIKDDGEIIVHNDDEDDERCGSDDLALRAMLAALGVADPSILEEKDDEDDDAPKIRLTDKIKDD